MTVAELITFLQNSPTLHDLEVGINVIAGKANLVAVGPQDVLHDIV